MEEKGVEKGEGLSMLCKRGSKRGNKTLRLKNVRRDTCPQPLVMSVCEKGRAKVSKVYKKSKR